MKGYDKVDLLDAPVSECCCGTVRRAFVDVEDAPASVHYLKVKEEPVSHYHQKTAEIYLILEGEGHLELDGEMVPVKPLSAVLIRPGCRHRAVGPLTIINIPVPRHDKDDFFYEDDAVKNGEAPVH